jgi:hypothetical protein
MKTNQYGHCAPCVEEYCAWWDKETNMCAIPLLAKATVKQENKRVQTVTIERNDWGKDI